MSTGSETTPGAQAREDSSTGASAGEGSLSDGSLPISAVERDTGIGKDTLRVWERRYGFPAPARDAHGERVYPLEQVHTLRIVRRLLDIGHRPGRVLRLSPAQIRALAESSPGAPLSRSRAPRHELERLMGLLSGHESTALHAELVSLLHRLGPRRFVLEVAAPMNTAVGDAWMRGRLEVFEEHVYSEQIQAVMRQAIADLTPASTSARPRVLLSTLPGEPHGLGLLMAEILLRLEGCECVSLGTQTPVVDLVRAAAAHGSDVVALSASSLQGSRPLLSGLGELRALLPPETQIWAGGAATALRRTRLAGVTPVTALEGIAGVVQRWRLSNTPGAARAVDRALSADPIELERPA